MKKPNLIDVRTLDGIVEKGTCPLCGAVFVHAGEIGQKSKNQVPDLYATHLKEKHPEVLREDASQAAVRIVREATENH